MCCNSNHTITLTLRFKYILGDPGAVSRVAGIFVGESRTWAKVYCKNETNPWAITLTEPVPEAFEIPAFDWVEKYFSAQSAKRTSRVPLMPSYTKLFSSSIATVAWAFQREDSRRDFQKKNSAKSGKSQPLTWLQVNKHSPRNFNGGLIEGIVVS